jgi:hypothetical protein
VRQRQQQQQEQQEQQQQQEQQEKGHRNNSTVSAAVFQVMGAVEGCISWCRSELSHRPRMHTECYSSFAGQLLHAMNQRMGFE